MCALDAAEITAVSFLGEVGEEAHHALSKMSAAKAIAGGKRALSFVQLRAQPSSGVLSHSGSGQQHLKSLFSAVRAEGLVSKDAPWVQGSGEHQHPDTTAASGPHCCK